MKMPAPQPTAILLCLWLAQVIAAAAQTPAQTPDPHHFRFERPVTIAAGPGPQACAVLDAPLYAHAGTALNDLRLYNSAGDPASAEVPYVILVSNPATEASEAARILNLGTRGSGSTRIVFDLDMPPRPYTAVDLDLAAHDFIATAHVFGEAPAQPATNLGVYTLYDLTAERLSRNTTLPLAESTFPRLHVELTLTPAPGTPAAVYPPSILTGASVPPSRQAQTLYTTVAETAALTHNARRTIASFRIPARVPVERVEFLLPESFHANFSRSVTISAQALTPRPDPEVRDTVPEQLTGEISRVDLTQLGHAIHRQQLTVPAILGANLQHDAQVEVAILDGDDRPLPIAAVRLEMRQRTLCFDAPATRLFYGDPALHAPVYDYARLYAAGGGSTRLASLGPEQLNPLYTPRLDTRAFTERHPELLWLVLIAVILALGFVAFRSAKRLPTST